MKIGDRVTLPWLKEFGGGEVIDIHGEDVRVLWDKRVVEEMLFSDSTPWYVGSHLEMEEENEGR